MDLEFARILAVCLVGSGSLGYAYWLAIRKEL